MTNSNIFPHNEFKLDEKLKQFDMEAQSLKSRTFDTFPELETAFCDAINIGTEIIRYINENPQVCDENSLKVLTNKSQDLSLLSERFAPMANLVHLTRNLLMNYERYSKKLYDEKKYEEAIAIYEQMFKFSHNYMYKLNIANILLKLLHKPKESLEIYKQAEPYIGNRLEFLWGIADVYWQLKDYYTELCYAQKALEIEMKRLEGA